MNPETLKKTEERLDALRERLVEYEALIIQRHEVANRLAEIDAKLNDTRKSLIYHRAQNGRSNGKPASLLLLPAKQVEKPKTPDLSKLNSRVQKSMSEVIKIITKAGGQAHVGMLSDKLGISRSGADMRVATGVQHGVLVRLGKGLVGVRSWARSKSS